MNNAMVVALVLLEMVSLFLLYRLVRSKRGILEKLALSVMLLIPFLEPLIFLILVEEVPPQHPFLRNAGARGDVTHRMIGIQADLDALESPLADIEEFKQFNDVDSQGSNSRGARKADLDPPR